MVLALATNGASALEGRLVRFTAPNCVASAGVGGVADLSGIVYVLPTGQCTIIEPTTTTPFLSYQAYQRDFPPSGQACAVLVFADTICNTTTGAAFPLTPVGNGAPCSNTFAPPTLSQIGVVGGRSALLLCGPYVGT